MEISFLGHLLCVTYRYQGNLYEQCDVELCPKHQNTDIMLAMFWPGSQTVDMLLEQVMFTLLVRELIY